MKALLLATALLVVLPLLPVASAGQPDPDEFAYCTRFVDAVIVCVSRDNTWYCYGVYAPRPLVEDCFQFIGP